MERFIQSIEKSIEFENWYSALTLALTLPDICGRLNNPKNGSQKRFEEWFNKYVLHNYESPFHGEGFTFLSGADCYALRCAFLHEGRDDVTRQRAREVVSRFSFSTTGSHKCMFDTVLLLNLQSFCTEICEGVRFWEEEYKNDTDVKAGLIELLKIQTQGFSIAPGIFVQ
jgi:hypothetical protein